MMGKLSWAASEGCGMGINSVLPVWFLIRIGFEERHGNQLSSFKMVSASLQCNSYGVDCQEMSCRDPIGHNRSYPSNCRFTTFFYKMRLFTFQCIVMLDKDISCNENVKSVHSYFQPFDSCLLQKDDTLKPGNAKGKMFSNLIVGFC